MEQLVFKTEVFEGPLELLLALIAKNKMDILDIKISLIFDQYMEYVDLMKQMDMEVAGEFITMAAELMYIKSRMLLPKKEEEEDPRRACPRSDGIQDRKGSGGVAFRQRKELCGTV